MIAVSLGWWYHMQRCVQVHNYWKETLQGVGCDLGIREADKGKFDLGLELDEVEAIFVFEWSPENEQKVLDGLNAFGTVTWLSLGGKDFTENSLRRLQDVPPLESISFYGVGLRDFDALPPRVRMSVRSLRIDTADLDLESLAAIGDCRHLTKLQLNFLTFSGRCEWVKNLMDIKVISLYGSTGVSNIVPYIRSPKVTTFRAASTDLQDSSLTKVACLPNLQTCIISDTPITDRGLESFRGHPSLEELWIEHTNISDESISIFESLPSLRELALEGTKISQEAIDDFQRRHPEVEVDVGRQWQTID